MLFILSEFIAFFSQANMASEHVEIHALLLTGSEQWKSSVLGQNLKI